MRRGRVQLQPLGHRISLHLPRGPGCEHPFPCSQRGRRPEAGWPVWHRGQSGWGHHCRQDLPLHPWDGEQPGSRGCGSGGLRVTACDCVCVSCLCRARGLPRRTGGVKSTAQGGSRCSPALGSSSAESLSRVKLRPGPESVGRWGGASTPRHVPALPGGPGVRPPPWALAQDSVSGHVGAGQARVSWLLPCGHGRQAGDGAVNRHAPLSLRELGASGAQ